MSKIAVIIGDLVESRKVTDRDLLQVRLQESLEKVNNEYGSQSVASSEIVRGDEFEAGYEDPSYCFRVFSLLEKELFPARIRAGIGFGSVSTSLKESISLMDGNAFHRARSAVEEAKEADSPLRIKSSFEERDQLINTIFDLIGIIKENWTHRQREVANYYRKKDDLTQEAIAEEFGISQPAVAKILKRANVKRLEKADRVLVDQLGKYGDM